MKNSNKQMARMIYVRKNIAIQSQPASLKRDDADNCTKVLVTAPDIIETISLLYSRLRDTARIMTYHAFVINWAHFHFYVKPVL